MAYSLSPPVPPKVISTLPSITEMIYYLGGESNLLAVTPYCKYPKEAQEKEKIGSAYSLNLEKIVTLKPGVVFLAPIKGGKNEKLLSKLGISYEAIPYERLEDIEKGLKIINQSMRLGAHKKIESFQKSFEIKKLKPKEVLIVIGEDIKAGSLRSVRVAGTNTFYNDIIEKIGFTNAYRQDGASYPKLDLERIMKLKFDYIIRVGGESPQNSEVKKSWLETSYAQRIKFFFADYAVVPGPRINLLLKDILDVFGAKSRKN